MRLFHLADYHGSYAGSFIPMLRAALLAARERGCDRIMARSAFVKDLPQILGGDGREDGDGR